jgi:hypothetical protein
LEFCVMLNMLKCAANLMYFKEIYIR